MKLLALLCLLALQLVQEGACTHLETCECHEIRELVNATVQQAAANLEYKLSIMIETAISKIDTIDEAALSSLESSLIATMERLVKPIQTQLDYHLPPPLPTEDNPATSCRALHDRRPDTPSDYYWIGKSGSPAVKMYCDMTRTCGSLTGGWMRVANIDMTNTSQQCPSGLTLISTPKRVCDTVGDTCVSNTFTTQGIEYTHVCGRVIGYQKEYSSAFYYRSRRIDENYIFGVSLTHGQNPRKHIWTFAGALDDTTHDPNNKCSCTNTAISALSTPSFVGNDYFCDTSLSVRYSTVPRALQPSKPLWDGEGCGSSDTCCSFPGGSSTPPWFAKDLPSSTTDNIEMRVCQPDGSGSTPIEIVELYVQWNKLCRKTLEFIVTCTYMHTI